MLHRNLLWILTLCGFSLLSLTACSGGDAGAQAAADNSSSSGPGYRVVTTCGMVTDLVTRVAGDRAEVDAMMSNDVDPHTYSPTRNDIAQLEAADVIFYSGLNLEARLADLLVRMAGDGKRVVPVTRGIPTDSLLEPEEFEGHYDPHVWNDASLWAATLDAIRETLSAQDPGGASGYMDRAKALEAEILAVHEYAKESLATIPAERRVLITAHDAFNYFGRAYDIEVHGVQGVTTEHEAGLSEINRLVDLIVERKVEAIFVEQAFQESYVEAVVEGARERGHTVRVGGTLYSDAMGEAGTYSATFVGMVDHNATTITRALGGDAPAGGLNGRLAP